MYMNPAGSQIVNAALMELKKSMGLFMHNARFPIQVAELFFPAWDGREGGTRESPVIIRGYFSCSSTRK